MQCRCGEFYNYRSYDVLSNEDSKDLDLCHKCIAASTPKSYINSKEFQCDNLDIKVDN